MGRLSGIPHFFTEASFYEEKNDAAALRRAKKLDDDGEALLAEQLQAVKRLQSHLTGHFLRRTPESLDYKGGVLLPLPPYQEILGVLTLTERETAIIQRRAEAAKAVSVYRFQLCPELTPFTESNQLVILIKFRPR